MKKYFFYGFLIALIFVAGCSHSNDTTTNPPLKTSPTTPDSPPNWFTFPLTDVNTQETFTLNDFKGTPILVESFAVWCPTCTRQQQESKKLHDELGASVISISLDTDENEAPETVREHTERNGFDWRYAVSPADLTRTLIDEFGVGIVNAPSVPMILICPDQSYQMLSKRGIKPVAELKQALATCPGG